MKERKGPLGIRGSINTHHKILNKVAVRILLKQKNGGTCDGRGVGGLGTTVCCKRIYLAEQVPRNLNLSIGDGNEDLVEASEEDNMGRSSIHFVSDTGPTSRHWVAQSKRGESLHG